MDLIQRLKKKNIINEDNTFNSNKEEYSNFERKDTYEMNTNTMKNARSNLNQIMTDFLKKEATPKRMFDVGMAFAQSGNKSLWDTVLSIANDNTNKKQNKKNSIQPQNNFQINTNANNIQNVPNLSNTQNMVKPADNKKAYEKTDKKNNMPLNTRLVTSEETENAKPLSVEKHEQNLKAQEKNKKIEKGGIEAEQEKINSLLSGPIGAIDEVTSGLANVATTAGALLTKGASKVVGAVGNEELQEKIDDAYDSIVEAGNYIYERGHRYSNINSQLDDNLTRTSTQIANIITQLAATKGIGKVVGVAGTVVQGLFVGGGSAQEVLTENKDNIVQATVTGTAKGYTSYLTEKIFDANILTKGAERSSIQEAIDKTINNKIKSEFGKEFANKTIGIIGENVEELAEDNIDLVIDKLVNNKEMPRI